ncbi:UNVERIFIED_CONTAM: hypothetical protein Sangu_2963100 [Sesamum angustifolium]|uniref:Uncharacterized protein n=1 Tax=Sesamum angustifolium TaxID=2727405 RepID=A0AAW2IJA6_9LAMI
MVPRRSKDSSTGGASGEMMILETSVPGSVNLGVAVAAVPERGVNEALETTYKAWVVPLDVFPAFYLFATLVGVSMIYSRLKLCVPRNGVK